MLTQHKNKKRGKDRGVYFPPETLGLLRRLANLCPDGPLLRNVRDAGWRRDMASIRMKRLCEQGTPGGPVPSVSK